MSRARYVPLVATGCPRCKVALSSPWAGTNRCPVCGGEFEAALFTPPEVRVHVRRVAEGGPVEAAACALHELNSAVGSCDRCGTFYCDLCKVADAGRTLCAPCFDRNVATADAEATSTRTRNYSGMSWVCLVGATFLWCYFGVVLGPLAVHFALKGRRQSLALGAGAWWLQVALGIASAVAQLAFWIAALAGMYGA